MRATKVVCWLGGRHPVLPGRGPSFHDLSNHRVEEARAEDIPIHCWTVNHSQQIRKLIEWRLAGVTTDYPESVVRMTQNI